MSKVPPFDFSKFPGILAARETLLRRLETLYHGGTRDCIMAAEETLSRRQGRPYRGGKSDSTAAVGETLPRRQERF